MSVESGRGWVQVALTFELESVDNIQEIEKNLMRYIDKCLDGQPFPYEQMKIEHVEIEGSDIDYRDWDYEDRINYIEDTHERVRK